MPAPPAQDSSCSLPSELYRHYCQTQENLADQSAPAAAAEVRAAWQKELRDEVVVAGQYGCIYQAGRALWALLVGRRL